MRCRLHLRRNRRRRLNKHRVWETRDLRQLYICRGWRFSDGEHLYSTNLTFHLGPRGAQCGRFLAQMYCSCSTEGLTCVLPLYEA